MLAYFNIHAFMGVTPRYARPVLGVSCVAAALGLRSLLERNSGAERPLVWPGRLASTAGVFMIVVYLLGAGQVLLDAWRWRGEFTYLPTEYLESPRRYSAIKDGNAAGVTLAFQGRIKEAEFVFTEVLRREPLFGESLQGRAMVRDFQANRNGAARDYRTLLFNLEFPSTRSPSPETEARLRQF